MYENEKFAQMWKSSVDTVRDVMADRFDKPNFCFDHNSADAHQALSFILDHDRTLDFSDAEYQGFSDLCEGVASPGKSELAQHGMKFQDVVSDVYAVLQVEVMLNRQHKAPVFEPEAMEI